MDRQHIPWRDRIKVRMLVFGVIMSIVPLVALGYFYVKAVEKDAATRNLITGDTVKIKAPDLEAKGRVYVTNGIKPGVVGCSFNYGHFAYGSASVQIDGKDTGYVKPYGHTKWGAGIAETGLAMGRDTGFGVNDIQMRDVALKNACLSDPIGGGSCPMDNQVEIVKVP